MAYVLQVLFPYIVLFYVIDCFLYLKKHQVAFTSHFGKRFKLRNTGLRFIGLSPFCRVFLTLKLPIFFSKNGIYIWNKSELSDFDLYLSESFDHILFDEIKSVTSDGHILTINQCLNIDVHTSLISDNIAERILLLKNLPSGKRMKETEHYLECENDCKMIKKNSATYLPVFVILEILSSLLFISIFILVPLFLYVRIPLNFSFVMLFALACYLLIVVISCWHIQSRFKVSKTSLKLLATLVVSPLTSIHIIHNLTKHSLISFDFIALSATLLRTDDFQTILKKELKRIYFSKLKTKGEELHDCLILREKYLKRLLSFAGLTMDNIFEQPHKQDSEAFSYCPLCEAGFVEGVGTCPDCNIHLVAYRLQEQ